MARSFNNTLIQFSPSDAFLTHGDGSTIAFWLRTTQTTSNTGLVSWWNGSSRGGEGVLINNVAGKMSMAFSGGIDGNILTTSAGWNDGNWHHFACSFDRTTTAGGVKLYKDGVADGTGARALSFGQGGQTLNIGAVADGFWGRYVGDMADFGMWDVKLDPLQIAALARGAPCSYIRPERLQVYVPMVD